MTNKDNALPERTMLYRIGEMIRCGAHSLDYIIAEGEDELKKLLKDNWFKTPEEAKDADDAAQEAATQAALEAQIAANKAAGAKSEPKPARTPRQPKPVKGSGGDAEDNAKNDSADLPAPDAPDGDTEEGEKQE